VVGNAFQKASPTPKAFNASFTIPVLNVPAEFLLSYHQYFFQALLVEIFNPMQEGEFYNPSDPEELTNDSSIIISSSWNDTIIKTGQTPVVVVDSEYAAMSPLYLADRRAEAVTKNGNKTTEHSACQMDIGMLLQVVAGRPQEANNLSNLIAVEITKMRRFIREFFGLYTISYPQVSPAAPMEGSPSNKFISSIRFKTQKMVNWSETKTDETYRNIIYRLVGVMSVDDKNPIVQMVLNSDAMQLDPKLKAYIEKLMKK
jgi:hypothetical protein